MEASKKPYLVAITVQLIYTGMFVISKAAFDQGMSTYVFMFYRQAAGFVLLLPFALLQRKDARSISSWTLLMLFFSSFIGHNKYCSQMSSYYLTKLSFLFRISFYLNLYYVCLKFTSATVASVAENSLPVLTFSMAPWAELEGGQVTTYDCHYAFIELLLLTRMERVKLRSSSGAAKMTGVVLCLAGVFVIAFYTGPGISPVNHHRAFSSHASGSNANVARGVWFKWTLLMVLANVAWSLWIILQVSSLASN
ncbi:hypothetical protein PR202_gb11434 [Eleusine coracana subsp. coracana]|uniref:WAT1-related protein n=1 Tax=Eleusine coracana subsp. coracana TaxID=191504 RepID=A0AAV5EMI6_ELECO|nr:hypothetical protein PR202_gb11434 [Eleusine coracana subsp. coracana]